MSLVAEYRSARRAEDVARLRRVLALRAMVATGLSQREIGAALEVSQPAVSQQLKAGSDVTHVHPELLLEAAAPILKQVMEAKGFRDLAVFGSVARHRARVDSDIDLLVTPPPGTSVAGMVAVTALLEQILGRSVDLVSYRGLKPVLDDDVRREAVLL